MVPLETCAFGALCLILNNSITWASCVGLDPTDNEVFYLQKMTQTSFQLKHQRSILVNNNNKK